MARQILVLPESLMAGQFSFLPAGMVDDLLNVSKAQPEVLERLAADLEQERGIPSDNRLEELIGRHFGDRGLVESLLRAVVNLRPEGLEDTIRTLRQWREASPQNGQKLPAESLETLQDRLQRLIRPYPALARYRKAQRLRTVTGRTAQALELICDLRPVFDQTRTVVEGLIPLTLLRVVYQSSDGSGALEVLLSTDDLDNLASEVDRARQKLNSLREIACKWVPDGWVEPD